MAIIRHNPFEDGRVWDETTSGEKAYKVWQILHDLAAPDDERQREYVASVRMIYLNWRTAPDEYVQHNQDWIMEAAVRQWCRDRKGNYVRPDSGNPFDVVFAEKWGLLQNGISSTKARQISVRLNRHTVRHR